jgi:DNA invertase Pin-like site-specific DNA recombinase
MKGSHRKPNPGLVWAYCRVSTLKTEQELSLDEQVRWAEEYARIRGCTVRIFKERASAKTIIGRPQCAKMLGALESGLETPPTMLIATSFDRISRDMTDTLIIARALRASGVRFYIRDRGEIAMDSFADQASLVGQAMGGHAENEARSNRCKASWERRRREGKPTSNKAPYGLQLKAERDTPEPTSAPWVKLAFEMYADGISMVSIARHFAQNAPPHRVLTDRIDADGNRVIRERIPVWEHNRVRKLFAQPRYRETIVDPALFDKVQYLIGAKPKWRQERKFEYPLSGAIKCATCNRSFHGHATGSSHKVLASGTIAQYKKSRTRYYSCTVCHYMINADKLEAWFEHDIQRLTATPEAIQDWLSSERRNDQPALQREKEKLERELRGRRFDQLRERAWELALADSSTSADLPRQLKSIANEEASVRDRIAQLGDAIRDFDIARRSIAGAKALLKSFRRLYAAAPYEKRRELANAVVVALGSATATKDGIVWLRGTPVPGTVSASTR